MACHRPPLRRRKGPRLHEVPLTAQWPSSMDRDVWRDTTPMANRSTAKPGGRVTGFDATDRRPVASGSAAPRPTTSPHGQKPFLSLIWYINRSTQNVPIQALSATRPDRRERVDTLPTFEGCHQRAEAPSDPIPETKQEPRVTNRLTSSWLFRSGGCCTSPPCPASASRRRLAGRPAGQSRYGR